MQVGEYVSPDGKLKFLVTCPDGDWIIGFDGFPSHEHGDLLAIRSGLDEVSAVERFVGDLIGNVSVIVLTRRSGMPTDVWVTDNPADTLSGYEKYRWPDETIQFRLWDGTTVKV